MIRRTFLKLCAILLFGKKCIADDEPQVQQTWVNVGEIKAHSHRINTFGCKVVGRPDSVRLWLRDSHDNICGDRQFWWIDGAYQEVQFSKNGLSKRSGSVAKYVERQNSLHVYMPIPKGHTVFWQAMGDQAPEASAV
jgi:hypothetical protein